MANPCNFRIFTETKGTVCKGLVVLLWTAGNNIKAHSAIVVKIIAVGLSATFLFGRLLHHSFVGTFPVAS